MIADGRTGSITAADGSINPQRTDKTGAIVATDGHGHFQEATIRANMFIVSTAVAGVAPGTVLSTTPPMALWNPINSGKNLVINAVTLGYVSGTLGGGSLVYAQALQITIPLTGTELTPVNALLAYGKGVGRAFQGSTLSLTPTLIRPAFILGAALATTATFPVLAKDLVDGEIIIPPGVVFVVQGVAAAGTSPLIMISITWEEVPI